MEASQDIVWLAFRYLLMSASMAGLVCRGLSSL